MIEVVDNYLSVEDLKKVQDIIFSLDFPFYWNGRVIKNGGEEPKMFYFTHLLFDTPQGNNSEYFNALYDIFYPKMNIKALNRMKINLYTSNIEQFEHGYHFDRKYPHKGAIFSLNSCDGYTKFETGEQIESVENRMMFFDPSIPHTSANTTNVKRRININFNYF